MSMRQFDIETAIEQVDENQYRTLAGENWAIAGNINGGWSMTVAARAAVTSLPHSDPIGVTGSYMAPVVAGEILLKVRQLSASRGTSFAQVELLQQDRLCCHFTVAASDLARMNGGTFEERTPPELPPWDECTPVARAFPSDTGFPVSMRYPPDQPTWLKDGVAPGTTSYEWWMRHNDDSAIEPLDLPTFADLIPPVVFNMLGPIGWVPTVQLALQVRRRPVGNLLKIRVQGCSLTEGLMEEDTELWDAEDRLVAISRQLMKVRRPR